jgi:parvulin-like peptidyl-prolyl isomerase
MGMIVAAFAACGGDKTETPKDKKASAKSASSDAKKATPKSGAAAKGGEEKTTKAASPKATGPIAKINGKDLDRAEFDKKYAKMTKAFTVRKKDIPEGLAQRYKESILKQLVDKELLRQAIAKEGVKVDAAALDKEFAEYKKMFRTDENFQRYLKSSEVSIDQIKANIEHNLAVTALLEKKGNLAVNDPEVKEYFEKNKARYEVKEQVRASHILFKVGKKDDKAKDAEAKKKADDIYKQAKAKGADFAALAKKHSQGPTAPRGGDLSYFTRGRMVPAFEKVAFAMKVGDVAKPVRTQFGWHIIKVTDKKEGRQRPFEEVKESISKLLRNKKSRQAKAELLKGLREGAKIESFLPKAKTPPKIMPKKMAPKSAPKPAAPKSGK